MPGQRKPDTRRGTNGPEKVAFTWTSNASTESLAAWDIKPQLLTDAILAGLACGLGIMLGRSQDGGAISVTIYDGESKSRKWVSDVVDLEDALTAILQHARAKGIDIPRGGLRAIGD